MFIFILPVTKISQKDASDQKSNHVHCQCQRDLPFSTTTVQIPLQQRIIIVCIALPQTKGNWCIVYLIWVTRANIIPEYDIIGTADHLLVCTFYLGEVSAASAGKNFNCRIIKQPAESAACLVIGNAGITNFQSAIWNQDTLVNSLSECCTFLSQSKYYIK